MKEQDNYVKIVVEKEETCGCGDGRCLTEGGAASTVFRIIVEDNGKGMAEDEIASKNQELENDTMKKQSSIGIANVNRRLKAVYGREYGIHIESRSGGGLRVILRFKTDEVVPVVQEEGI